MLFGPEAFELFSDRMILKISSESALCMTKFDSTLSDRYFLKSVFTEWMVPCNFSAIEEKMN